MATYLVCSECSPIVAHGDMTGIDEKVFDDMESFDEYVSSVESSVEIIGNAAHAGAIEHGGYFRCFVCGADAIGGNIWEGDDKL